MNAIIFGPPGSGKGTQAAAICQKFNLVHVSTGDMLREAVRNGTELGKQAQAIMSEGKLVPDAVVNGIVRDKVVELNKEGKGVLFDGYPRTLDQARALDGCLDELGLKIDVAAALMIPSETLVKRICGRRLCTNPECDSAYNVYFMAPKEEGKCDKCGSALEQRKDDNEETLRERLEVYESQTAPILGYYNEKDVLIKIKGDATVDQVRDALLDGIDKKLGG